MGCLKLKHVEGGPQKGIQDSRAIINRVPEDLYVACQVGWEEGKKELDQQSTGLRNTISC